MNGKVLNQNIPFHLVNEDPLVCITVALPYLEKLAPLIGNRFRKNTVYILAMIWWSAEIEGEYFLRINRKLKFNFPNLKIIFLCNTEEEVRLLQRFEMDAFFINHNAFVDESLFFIEPNVEKRFSAIYNAAWAPYKRHHLAREVKDLAIISYSPESLEINMKELKDHFPNAVWVNYQREKGFYWIDSWLVRKYLNQSGCGLCLSKAEGAMFSSIEYLLCGLPVVTTKSIGGRHIFFEPSFSFVAKETKESVKRTVEDANNNIVSPEDIRRKTILKISAHRKRYNMLIKRISDSYGKSIPLLNGWRGAYTNKMFRWIKEKDILCLLARIYSGRVRG